MTDQATIEALQARIETLEKRIQDLEAVQNIQNHFNNGFIAGVDLRFKNVEDHVFTLEATLLPSYFPHN